MITSAMTRCWQPVLIRQSAIPKKADWIGDRFKERELARALREETASYNVNIDDVLELARKQKEYH